MNNVIASSPFFSVVIATHNRAEMLSEAITSVLNQSFTDFEILVIDDNCTDNSRDIVSALSDSRISYLVNTRTPGASGARNTGIFHAKGNWIAFLDDDDLWLPQKLAVQYEKIVHSSTEIGLLFSGYTLVFENGDQKDWTPSKQGDILLDLLYTNVVGAFPTVVIRRDLLLMIGGMDETFPSLEDLELHIQIARICRVAFTPEPLALIRTIHEERITRDMLRRLKGYICLYEKYYALYSVHPRLHHRIASQILYSAVLIGEWRQVQKMLGWTLLGIIVDPKNVYRLIKQILRYCMERSLPAHPFSNM